jgi:hypothetical protein
MEPTVGQIVFITDDDTAIVTAVRPERKTLDLNYTIRTGEARPMLNDAPPGMLDRPFSEIVTLPDGKVIWNHE